MKLAVIGGAGALGSTTGFYSGLSGLFEEIKLLDIKENVQKSHAMDINQAILGISKTSVSFGTYEDLSDSDIIVITASMPEVQVKNRNEYLFRNLGLIESICENIKPYAKDKVLVNATAPIDIFNYVTYKQLGWARDKFIGFCLNDSMRLRWAVSEAMKVPYDDVEAICLGEHGEGQVPVYSTIRINGELANFDAEQIAAVAEQVDNWFRQYQSLDSRRTTGWTSGVNITNVLRHIVEERDDIINCSCVLDGEYGQSGMSIGVPVRLGRSGIREIIEMELNAEEKAKFAATSQKLRDIQVSAGI